MTDYAIAAPNRRCNATGRDLPAGAQYFGVMLEEPTGFVRRDFAADAWNGPPDGAIGFWSGRVPASENPKRPPIDDDGLLDCFTRLEGTAKRSRLSFRYVLALLLMRRKRLKYVESRSESLGETLSLRDSKTGERHEVRDPGLTAGELSDVQNEVFQVLGWD